MRRSLLDDGPTQPADRMVLGETLRHMRLSQGLSLRTVADRAGVAHSLVSHLEHGRRNVTLDTLAAIAAALGARIVVDLHRDADATDLAGWIPPIENDRPGVAVRDGWPG